MDDDDAADAVETALRVGSAGPSRADTREARTQP
jgi:hypothetical protein